MKVPTLFASVLAYSLTTAPALAGGDRPDPYEPIDAQAIVDACRQDAQLEDDTAHLRSKEDAAGDVGLCYISEILRLMEPLFDPVVFAREEAEKLLVRMHRPAFDFYAHVLTYHRKCPCGDDPEVAFRLAAQKPFLGVLAAIADIRKEYSN